MADKNFSLGLSVAEAVEAVEKEVKGELPPAQATPEFKPPPFSPTLHVKLTTHPKQYGVKPMPIKWGAATPSERGPVVAGHVKTPGLKNAIGAHSGSYSIYRALTIAKGDLSADFKPDLTNTSPSVKIGPFPSWSDPTKIVSLDPWGASIADAFKDEIQKVNIMPTIAVTKAHCNFPELREEVRNGHLNFDPTFFDTFGNVKVTKAAIEPVWYLPGVAERFGITEGVLRRALFEHTGGMFPELITRPDLEVFLPPIGGATVYIVGPTEYISDPTKKLAVRVHDECNGSDVFGSDICTCRPYLVHGMEVCIQTAQEGGVGVIVYWRKEGRALGEVTKFLVYNARKRQEGGDRAETYFKRTECVAGVQDMRFQELMPDVLHWLGITKIDKLVSMSDMKYNAITSSGIEVIERLDIPDHMVPPDAQVEINAKIVAGYNTSKDALDKESLLKTAGREYFSPSDSS